MLNTKLFDKRRRENARGERAAEDGAKLSVKTSNAHILKLEIGLKNCVWRRPVEGQIERSVSKRTSRKTSNDELFA